MPFYGDTCEGCGKAMLKRNPDGCIQRHRQESKEHVHALRASKENSDESGAVAVACHVDWIG